MTPKISLLPQTFGFISCSVSMIGIQVQSNYSYSIIWSVILLTLGRAFHADQKIMLKIECLSLNVSLSSSVLIFRLGDKKNFRDTLTL
jgi:hypothetical protein